MGCAYQKSAVSMYNTTSTSVASGGIIPYTTIDVDTGVSLTPNKTSGSVIINKVGLYLVEYVGTVSISSSGSSSSTNVSVQLNANGTLVNGTKVQNTTASTGFKDLSFSKIIKVDCSTSNEKVVLTVVNPTSSTETFISSNLSVVKLA